MKLARRQTFVKMRFDRGACSGTGFQPVSHGQDAHATYEHPSHFLGNPFSFRAALSMESALRDGCFLHAQSLTFRRRSALVITETELKVMAAAAIMGLSSRPNTG